MAERSLQLMKARGSERKAFGVPLVKHGTVARDIAQSRVEVRHTAMLPSLLPNLIDGEPSMLKC